MVTKLDKYDKLAVAVDKNGVWDWNKELPNTYRRLYYTKEQTDRFFRRDNILYVWSINKTYLNLLCDAGEKVAGNRFVLALMLSDGQRGGKDFQVFYTNIKSRKFVKYYTAQKLMKKLEKYLKEHALACGVFTDRVRWRPPAFGEVELKTLQNYYSRKPEDFIVIDEVLYYCRPFSAGVEALYHKCLELAGSEYALALATSNDRLTCERHQKAFSRLSFKHRKNIEYYAEIFEKFLYKNPQLFDEKVAI